MSLKRIFEQLPPTYDESTRADLPAYSPRAPTRQTVWRRVLMLYILQAIDAEDEAERYLDILQSFRSVSRVLYNASMSLLRARYLPGYLERVKRPMYQSNLTAQTLSLPRRERRVLDYFVAYSVHRTSRMQQSMLLLNNDSEHEQADQDLFGWLQPQTYLEDEVCKALTARVRSEDILVRFEFRRAAVTMPCEVETGVSRREVAFVERSKGEAITVTAARLCEAMRDIL